MKLLKYGFYILLFGIWNSTLYSQDNIDNKPTPSFCKNIMDENQNKFIPQKGLVLLYFLDPKNQDSINMQPLVNQLKLQESSIQCFQVDTALSTGLKKTYQILSLPSIVILQDKRVIYGLNGFTDDIVALTDILNAGIKNHLLISIAK